MGIATPVITVHKDKKIWTSTVAGDSHSVFKSWHYVSLRSKPGTWSVKKMLYSWLNPWGLFFSLHWVLRLVKTSNTKVNPDELAVLLSSSFSFDQQFSHLGISCRVLLTVSFPTRVFSSSPCSHANFQMSSVTSCPSPAIWEPQGILPFFQLLGFDTVGGHVLASTYYAGSFSKSLLAFLPELMLCPEICILFAFVSFVLCMSQSTWRYPKSPRHCFCTSNVLPWIGRHSLSG